MRSWQCFGGSSLDGVGRQGRRGKDRRHLVYEIITMRQNNESTSVPNGLIVDKVCTWDPVKLLFDWSDFMDLTVCRTELKLLLRL